MECPHCGRDVVIWECAPFAIDDVLECDYCEKEMKIVEVEEIIYLTVEAQ